MPIAACQNEQFPTVGVPTIGKRGMLRGHEDAVDFLSGWLVAKEGRVRSQAGDSGPMRAGYDAFKTREAKPAALLEAEEIVRGMLIEFPEPEKEQRPEPPDDLPDRMPKSGAPTTGLNRAR